MVVKKIRVKSYKKKSPRGTVYRVKSHTKKMRSLGNKVSYKKAGVFMVGHDEKGNFRGSKIVPLSKPLKITKPVKRVVKKKVIKKRKREPVLSTADKLKKLDTDFFTDKITEKDWNIKRRRITNNNL